VHSALDIAPVVMAVLRSDVAGCWGPIKEQNHFQMALLFIVRFQNL
jgi:hypothetical protein